MIFDRIYVWYHYYQHHHHHLWDRSCLILFLTRLGFTDFFSSQSGVTTRSAADLFATLQ